MYWSSTVLRKYRRKPVKGLYLNTPPKPKQAEEVELQEAEEQELEVDGSLEEET